MWFSSTVFFTSRINLKLSWAQMGSQMASKIFHLPERAAASRTPKQNRPSMSSLVHLEESLDRKCGRAFRASEGLLVLGVTAFVDVELVLVRKSGRASRTTPPTDSVIDLQMPLQRGFLRESLGALAAFFVLRHGRSIC